ncbi:phage tail sheath C-terminal domain-containing protein [Actinoplanes sp. NPDC049802]|uniref:phage tail sheath family protein n=1 Tax=Actinoplanes sp. NPDC049802 TaxID=3154742 RepID=UPI0033CCB507
MPAETTYPGVYAGETATSTGSVTPVSTATAAFVGYTRRGPVGQPVRIGGLAEFERHFGGLSRHGAVGYAARQFFANGGTSAVIVRVIKEGSAEAASVTLTARDHGHDHHPHDEDDRGVRETRPPREETGEDAPEERGRPGHGHDHGRERPVLEVHAKEPGRWGDDLHVHVDHATRDPHETFNLHVVNGPARESFRDLSMDPDHDRYAPEVINEASKLIRAEAVGQDRPDPNGTISHEFDRDLPDCDDLDITVRIGDEERRFRLFHGHHDGPPPRRLSELAALLERKLRAQPDCPGSTAFSGARVRAFGRRLQTVAGSIDENDVVHFEGRDAERLGLEAYANPPVFALSGGDDGDPPQPGDLIGDESAKSGLHALAGRTDVNLINLPDLAGWESIEDMSTVLSVADRIARELRALLLIDAPAAWTSVDLARSGVERLAAVRSDHAALYFPHLLLDDPRSGRPYAVPPSGSVAGVIARTDAERGVWKAPAGTAARLAGVRALTVPLTDRENGLLNPLAVNCLRTFGGTGPVVWGARTLDAGEQAGEWRYVPVRRLALHIEESLHRALRWVVFEPNDEQLWQAVRLEVGAYLDTLFRRGAFAGRTPREAFFVKCDASTTTESDIDNGVVNVVAGFAPVEPAEFVIVTIRQTAGQLAY